MTDVRAEDWPNREREVDEHVAAGRVRVRADVPLCWITSTTSPPE
jgi:hypothetical protein